MTLLTMVIKILVAIERILVKTMLSPSRYWLTQDYVSNHANVWRDCLGRFQGKSDTRLLEIGSYEGRSTLWFFENILTHPSSTITCIDRFRNRLVEIRFDHNLAVAGCSQRVVKIKNPSQRALRILKPDNYHIIYIDGSHRAIDVEADAWLSWPLLKSGGICIFDDYLWMPHLPEEDRPQVAIDKFLHAFGSQFKIVHKGYQVIVEKI